MWKLWSYVERITKKEWFVLLYVLFFTCLFIVALSSCGKVPNESWAMNNNGICNEIDYSYNRITFYHLTQNKEECHLIYEMNDAGFLVDDYMECDYGNYGIWRFFRTFEECNDYI